MSIRTVWEGSGSQINEFVDQKREFLSVLAGGAESSQFENLRGIGGEMTVGVLAGGAESSQFENLPDDILLKIKEWALPIKSHRMIQYPYLEHGVFSFHKRAQPMNLFLVHVRVNVKGIASDELRQCMKDAFGIQPNMRTCSDMLVVFLFEINVEPTRLFDNLVAEYEPKAKQALKLIVDRHIQGQDDSKTLKPMLYMGNISELRANRGHVQKYFPFSAGVYTDTQSNLSVLNRGFQNFHRIYRGQELPTTVPGS